MKIKKKQTKVFVSRESSKPKGSKENGQEGA